MSKMNDLINNLCSNGVNYMMLQEVCRFQNGFAFKSGLFSDRGEKIVRIANISDGRINDNGMARFELSSYKEKLDSYIVRPGDVVVAMSGATTGKIGYNFSNEEYYLNQRVGMFIPDESMIRKKYLYHWLLGQTDSILNAAAGAGAQPNLSSKKMMEFYIPVPPLSIQDYIIEILDGFVDLDQLLKKELRVRNIQLAFYTERLIGSQCDAKKYKLKDLFDFRNGLSKGKEFFGKGTPFIRYTDVYNNRAIYEKDVTARVECTEAEIKKLQVKRGDVLFTRTSETAEDVGLSAVMLDDIGECVFNGFTIKATPKTDLLLPEYCAYCFSISDFRNYVTSNSAFTTRASLTGKTIGEYVIEVPDKEEQMRIVSVLDKIYMLCRDESVGINAELRERRKQYEYYRNKLFEFKGVRA